MCTLYNGFKTEKTVFAEKLSNSLILNHEISSNFMLFNENIASYILFPYLKEQAFAVTTDFSSGETSYFVNANTEIYPIKTVNMMFIRIEEQTEIVVKTIGFLLVVYDFLLRNGFLVKRDREKITVNRSVEEVLSLFQLKNENIVTYYLVSINKSVFAL